MEIAMTRVSSKGQVVIPRELRDNAKLKEGEKLLVYGDKNTIVLKKVESPVKEFENLVSFSKKFAKQKGIKKSDVF